MGGDLVTSNAPALLDYLIAKFAGAATLGLASPPVTVFDGPNPAATELPTALDPTLKLFVGLSDPDNDGIQDAAQFTQARADLGFATRDETTSVMCCAEAWSGDDSIANARHAVFAIVAAVETLVRADNSTGGLGFVSPGVNAGALQQNNTSAGAVARVPFEIQFRSFT